MAKLKFKDENDNFIPVVQDVKVNNTSVFDGKEADIKLKSINNIPITGEGNIEIQGGGSSDYEELENLPKINNVELKDNKSLNDLGIQPAGNYIEDSNYVHTDNNYTTTEKNKLANLENYDDTEVKSDISSLQSGKQDKIDSTHKLSSDLVDDTNNTNKFVTSAEKTTWNNKSNFSGSYADLTNKPYTEYTFSSASVDINNLNDANYMIMNSGDLEIENDTISLSKGDLVFLNDGLVAVVCSMGNYFYEYQTDEWIGGACQTGADVNRAIETKFANIPEITKINIPTRGTNLKNINEGIYFNTSATGKIVASISGTNTDIPVTKNTMIIKDTSGNTVILGKDTLMILDYDSNNDYFTVNQDISNKQDELVSGTNIKTINNQSILGSGNLNISSEVPAPTTSTRGGIYAQTVQDTSNMQEVVVGSDGKAYVNNDYSSLVHNIVGEVEEEESEE